MTPCRPDLQVEPTDARSAVRPIITMRWQQIARLAIAAFVIVFAGAVVFIMRQRSTLPPPSTAAVPTDENTVVASSGAIEYNAYDQGRLRFSLKGTDHKVLRDGRTEIFAVSVTVPNRENEMVTITADKAVVQAPQDKVNELKSATFTGNVKLVNDKGVNVSAGEASYEESTGVVTIPGPVKFGRGRMSGSGLGATYDKNRDVLWILDKAHITVAPDAAGGGAAEANAGTIGMARSQNYIKMVKSASIAGDGRTASGDEITAWLNEGGETLKSLEIRGNSRITGTGPNAQNMSARDIDLGYAPDGRTLQRAHLVDNSVVELPGAAGAPGRRISAVTIDLGMAPDGATLTVLNATENVEVNLPPAGDGPAQRIRAKALAASGPPGAGLQNATFTGGVEHKETRAARGSLSAIDRTATGDRMILTTKPGLGDVEQADFRGHFRMEDNADSSRDADQRRSASRDADQRRSSAGSPDAKQGTAGTEARPVTAEAPRAIYHLNKDLIELSPEGGDPGPTPFVNDGRMRVSARNIRISPSTQKLSADTNVQSTMQPQKRTETTSGGRGKEAGQGHLPAMLKQDKPVTVVANRLEYRRQVRSHVHGEGPAVAGTIEDRRRDDHPERHDREPDGPHQRALDDAARGYRPQDEAENHRRKRRRVRYSRLRRQQARGGLHRNGGEAGTRQGCVWRRDGEPHRRVPEPGRRTARTGHRRRQGGRRRRSAPGLR